MLLVHLTVWSILPLNKAPYSNLRLYMHYTYTIFITHTSNKDKIKYCFQLQKADMFTFSNSYIENIRFACCTSQTNIY